MNLPLVINGDCLEELKSLPDNSIDAIVTDPPYGLSNTDPTHVTETILKWANGERNFIPEGKGFMGKGWDAFVPPPAVWDECLRVLKPGGHLLAFAGARTVDLMTLSIRLAGFDIRDTIAYLFGSGFPKSMNIGKAIDKSAGAKREVVGTKAARMPQAQASDWGNPGTDNFRDSKKGTVDMDITVPATDEAEKWEGWGTALKPANEPIVMARKPFSGTVASNVLEYGTGALNIDATRIIGESVPVNKLVKWSGFGQEERPAYEATVNTSGRWPANVALVHHEDCVEVGVHKVKSGTAVNRNRDNSDQRSRSSYGFDQDNRREDQTYGENGEETILKWECVPGCAVEVLNRQSGERKAGGKVKGHEPSRTGQNGIYSAYGRVENKPYTDTGGAARFFYTAKAKKSERPSFEKDGQKIVHPTVKPLALMQWLVRLVTQPGGIVLDPFAGSGSTLEAAMLEGFNSIGIEREIDYVQLIKQRIEKYATNNDDLEKQVSNPSEVLF